MSQSDTPTTVPLDGTVRPAAEARCIAARNKLNAVLHGEGAVIDDLESAVANAVAEIERLRVAMTDWRAAAEAAQQLLALAEKLQERAVAAESERCASIADKWELHSAAEEMRRPNCGGTDCEATASTFTTSHGRGLKVGDMVSFEVRDTRWWRRLLYWVLRKGEPRRLVVKQIVGEVTSTNA